MAHEKVFLICYNRGCGKKFNLNDNHPDVCIHHPGYPVFHDAYKGWSCCKKRCRDFTEFLNIKGCTTSCHNNEKPLEPQKPDTTELKENYVFECKTSPNESLSKNRPPFSTPQVDILPTVSPVLLEYIKNLDISSTSQNKSLVQMGQSCKNTACKATYQGFKSSEERCNYHPGVAIFHEGLKYWSCCQKKTTDFSIFLEQPGCTQGPHSWISTNTETKIKCRQDWHQTGSFVIISIYAKNYQPDKSSVRLNPVRLTAAIFFPMENSFYNIDLELRGMIEVEKSSVNMLPTKIEIKLKKANLGTWVSLNLPNSIVNESETAKYTMDDNKEDNIIVDCINPVDLQNL